MRPRDPIADSKEADPAPWGRASVFVKGAMKAVETKRTDLFAKAYAFQRAKELKAAGFYPYFIPIEGSEDTEVMIDGKRLIMVGSNNYLGLDPRSAGARGRPKPRRAATAPGCTGSRFLNGTLDLHEKLEAGSPSSSATRRRSSSRPASRPTSASSQSLVGRDDIVFVDKLDHASHHRRLPMLVGRDREALPPQRHWRTSTRSSSTCRGKKGGTLIVVDGVFSMEGDIAPLPR